MLGVLNKKLKMSNKIKVFAFGVALIFAGAVFAADTPPSLPDGPVKSPSGYKCTSSGGVVTCVKIKER